ncbi:MAG: tetratricopeptide repeat protein, partial [Chloroflexota bacterium]
TISLHNLGNMAEQRGEHGRAQALYEESLALRRALGDQWGIAVSLTALGLVASRRGEYRRAVALHVEALRFGQRIGARDVLAEGLEQVAHGAAADGQAARGARLGGAAERLRAVLGTPLPPALHGGHELAARAMRDALGESAFAAAWAEGQSLGLDEAVALALEGHAERLDRQSAT